MILIVQRWIICAYEQIPHRNMSVFCVRTQVFMIMVLVFQCWVICAYNQVHRGCILRADIPYNYLSSNAGLFAQVHRHMDVFYVRSQILLIIILIAQRWIICAYELIPKRHECILRTYAGIPYNGFGLPMLGYLRI